MKAIATKQATLANEQETTTIYNESQTSCLKITLQELEDYETQSGFGVEDITPDWIMFDLLMWIKDPTTTTTNEN
jgi:hypothetical protein